MSGYLKMGLLGALAMLGGCASMQTWTPEQTATFVQAMHDTANAVDPCEYAGQRQCYRPPTPAVVVVPATCQELVVGDPNSMVCE